MYKEGCLVDTNNRYLRLLSCIFIRRCYQWMRNWGWAYSPPLFRIIIIHLPLYYWCFWCCRKLGLDVVPRVNGMQVGPGSMSPTQLYQIHQDTTKFSGNATIVSRKADCKGIGCWWEHDFWKVGNCQHYSAAVVNFRVFHMLLWWYYYVVSLRETKPIILTLFFCVLIVRVVQLVVPAVLNCWNLSAGFQPLAAWVFQSKPKLEGTIIISWAC